MAEEFEALKEEEEEEIDWDLESMKGEIDEEDEEEEEVKSNVEATRMAPGGIRRAATALTSAIFQLVTSAFIEKICGS